MFFGTNVRGIAALSALVLFTSAASAQLLTVGPSVALTAGEVAKVTYVNVLRANQEVIIEISGGFPAYAVETIRIQLDANGVGVGVWSVARWRNASFNAPGAAPVMMPIL